MITPIIYNRDLGNESYIGNLFLSFSGLIWGDPLTDLESDWPHPSEYVILNY